jgi:hypothetical protein
MASEIRAKKNSPEKCKERRKKKTTRRRVRDDENGESRTCRLLPDREKFQERFAVLGFLPAKAGGGPRTSDRVVVCDPRTRSNRPSGFRTRSWPRVFSMANLEWRRPASCGNSRSRYEDHGLVNSADFGDGDSSLQSPDQPTVLLALT